MKLESKDIIDGQQIDIQFTKYGENKIPNLSWNDIPANTKELLLIVYDPDALPLAKKYWMHFIASNINPTSNNLENDYIVYHKNDFSNRKMYDGPMPPPVNKHPNNVETNHHYHFRLIALNCKLNLDSEHKYSFNDLTELIDGKVIDEVSIIGRYEKV